MSGYKCCDGYDEHESDCYKVQMEKEITTLKEHLGIAVHNLRHIKAHCICAELCNCTDMIKIVASKTIKSITPPSQYDRFSPAWPDEKDKEYRSPFIPHKHIIGKAYDLNQENMNAMILEIERLTKEKE